MVVDRENQEPSLRPLYHILNLIWSHPCLIITFQNPWGALNLELLKHICFSGSARGPEIVQCVIRHPPPTTVTVARDLLHTKALSYPLCHLPCDVRSCSSPNSSCDQASEAISLLEGNVIFSAHYRREAIHTKVTLAVVLNALGFPFWRFTTSASPCRTRKTKHFKCSTGAVIQGGVGELFTSIGYMTLC